MSRYVVDASVVVKWYIPEISSDKADIILNSPHELWMPDLAIAEIGNIIWKKIRLNELDKSEGLLIANEMTKAPLHIHESNMLLEATLELATAFDRTFYDSLYLALAVHLKCPFITADEKLFNVINQSPLQENIQLLSQI